MIPLPRPMILSSALLIGAASGVILAVALSLVNGVHIRPDAAIALILGVPSTAGLALGMASSRRWMTASAAYLIAIAPGWLSTLAAIQAVSDV